MQPEAPALIWDARRAAGRVLEFVTDRSWDDYQQDVMLRSAVERRFQIGRDREVLEAWTPDARWARVW